MIFGLKCASIVLGILGDGDFAHGGPWGKCLRKEFDLVYQRLNIQGLQERKAEW